MSVGVQTKMSGVPAGEGEHHRALRGRRLRGARQHGVEGGVHVVLVGQRGEIGADEAEGPSRDSASPRPAA